MNEPSLSDYLDAIPGARRAGGMGQDVEMTPELAAYFEAEEAAPETLKRGSVRHVRPVPGQPGVFRRSQLMQGFGDAAAVRALLSQADAKFEGIKANATRLLAIYGPLDTGVIARIKRVVSGLSPGFYAEMGAAEFAGLMRFCLQSAAYSLSLVHAMMNGPNPEGSTTAALLILTPTMQMLSTLQDLVRTTQTTEGAIQSFISSTGNVAQKIAQRLGLADLGLEPVETLVVVFVVAVTVYLLISQYESMASATEAANQACSKPGASCTADEWARIRDQALQASATLSILPNLGRAVEQAGSLLFWGGLLAVGGLLAYGAWVAQPAAMITRQKLVTRASAL